MARAATTENSRSRPPLGAVQGRGSSWPARSPACPSSQAQPRRETTERHAAAPAVHLAFSVEERPPGSRKVISSYQRICCFHTQPMIEVNQVGATAEQHVLAVVHHLARAGQFVRRSPSAEIGTPLKQLDAISCVRQRTAGRDTGEPAADDRDCPRLRILRFGHHVRRRQNPLPRTLSFSIVESRTFPEKTS